jgi:hypothetical protein
VGEAKRADRQLDGDDIVVGCCGCEAVACKEPLGRLIEAIALRCICAYYLLSWATLRLALVEATL